MQLFVLALIFLSVMTGVVALGRRPSAERIQTRMASMAAAAPPASILERELERPFTERFLRPFWTALSRLALRLTPSGSAEAIQQILDMAGNPPRLGVREFAVLRIASGILGMVLAFPVYHWTAGMLSPLFGTIMAGVCVYVGWTLPGGRLRSMGQARQYRIRKSLPDVLDLLLVSVEAGLGFDGAIAQVVTRMQGPLPDELRRVLDGMRLGKARSQALREMARRVQVTELNTFVGAINQADQLGTSIGGALRLQSREIRIARTQRIQELAAKLPVKMLFPLMFFIFPAIFIVIGGPAFWSILKMFSNK